MLDKTIMGADCSNNMLEPHWALGLVKRLERTTGSSTPERRAGPSRCQMQLRRIVGQIIPITNQFKCPLFMHLRP
jgi:hypothetical protein